MSCRNRGKMAGELLVVRCTLTGSRWGIARGRLGGRKSDRDASVLAIQCRRGFVVEPYPALAEVTEAQRGAGRDGHRCAAGAVRPPPQRMGEGIPVVEITHHRHGPA